ncbi:protein translocase subunit SecD [Fodinicola feengrottensis]|uniref:Protein translocase subunit SecD n=2 Tax=Fodinicola feengrottensis TaxID=435914 RepID=A0ABN2G451_9ACTN
MAPTGQLRVGRYFIALVVIVAALYAGVFFLPGADSKHRPQPFPQLGLDLVGGTTETLTATTQDGKAPSQESLALARSIIDQRVNALGVAEPDVVTEGDRNIVVTVAGVGADQLASVGQTAQLRFRQVISTVADIPAVTPKPSTSASPKPSGSASPKPGASPSAKTSGAAVNPGPTKKPASSTGKAEIVPAVGTGSAGKAAVVPAANPTPTPSTSATPKPSGSPSPAAPAPAGGSGAPAADKLPSLASVIQALGGQAYYQQILTGLQQVDLSDPTQAQSTMQQLAGTSFLDPFKKLTPAQIAVLPTDLQLKIPQISCAKLGLRPPGSIDNVNAQQVACDAGNKYLMDKATVVGTDVSSADFDYNTGSSTGSTPGWRVVVNFKAAGQDKWTKLTQAALNKQVAIVLDTTVVSAPTIQGVIAGQAEITGGGFTRDSSQALASQLKYGALPLTFSRQNLSSVSATLGLQQLEAGLIAGGIGLALVVVWVMFYYRLLGLVTVASLVLSGGIIYGTLVLLGRPWALGFTLSLAGIAGFIVSIGITADSFVIFFERLKDEIREGKTARSAVPRAWVRARRTIISGDTVSFLAAAVLYILASGAVKGFAFTLGMSTVVDLLVVFVFTHPLVALLSRSKTFMSARISGLGRAARQPSDDAPASAAIKGA